MVLTIKRCLSLIRWKCGILTNEYQTVKFEWILMIIVIRRDTWLYRVQYLTYRYIEIKRELIMFYFTDERVAIHEQAMKRNFFGTRVYYVAG